MVMAQQASIRIAVRDNRRFEASSALLHGETTAQVRANQCRLPSLAIDKLRREVEHDEATVVHGKAIFDGAFDARNQELQQGGGMAHRMRDRRLEMQRSIEELLAMRGSALSPGRSGRSRNSWW